MSAQANAKISATGGLTAALVAKAGAGDRDAFATLYNEHRVPVYRFLRTRGCDEQLAEDLTQDTFVRALGRIGTFAERPNSGGFGGWLYTIARNLHTDHCRASRTKCEVAVAEIFETDERCDSAESSALRLLDAAEAAATVRAAMGSLPGAHQECLRLRFLEELPLKDAATRLDRTTGAVKTLTDRAKIGMRASVRRALAAEAVAA
ncbi:sigma-70 family RNA polymerase sigma factor [Streptomyces turgidiscabies]|uniref:Sigma-70 region 2 n=1 Tax=Streptomyces turgidiscabies (strain Car8) TaxID=698760 RepID=L7F187_STRT8|nr:sigma-70 family RNA polymerase sigma factor [Streptomyces turgidiscabies]ELP65428.1 sigma-70 region 2 [Streptomyces turgidiscabies Car8]MDX3492153.1 sigma-70 family RNA polymerase sigma factor [Streptomyces turgidiscabies]